MVAAALSALWRVALVAALVLLSVEAEAARRVALVIGNAAYQVEPLVNPVNDARAVGDTLSGLGFKVIMVVNATKAQTEQALARLAEEVAGAEIGVVHFAGHGTRAYAADGSCQLSARRRPELKGEA